MGVENLNSIKNRYFGIECENGDFQEHMQVLFLSNVAMRHEFYTQNTNVEFASFEI